MMSRFDSLSSIQVSDIPNETTLAAMREAEDLLKDPDALKFTSADDLFAELRS